MFLLEFILIVQILKKLGNPEQAKAYLEKGLQFEPEHFLLTFNLAVLQLNSGEEFDAAKNFERCLKSMKIAWNPGIILGLHCSR